MNLRKTHNLQDDISLPIQSKVLGDAYQKTGNYLEAIRFYSMAIRLHIELPVDSRNDVQLADYYIKLCETYLMTNEINTAEKVIITAVGILSKQEAKGSLQVEAALGLMVIIYELKEDYTNAERLNTALKNMNS